MSGELGRLLTITSISIQGTLRGLRTLGLAVFGAIPSLIALALVSAHTSGHTLATTVEGLYALLTLPIVVMVIVLVIAVGLFRNEIDAETLVYLSDRSVSRSTIVFGKYLGGLVSSLLICLPAALLPLGIAALGGASAYPLAVPVAAAVATVLGVMAYVAFFLLLGLVSRSALIIGLLFGFVWEQLLPLLPGDVPRLTLVFYLRSYLSGSLTNGPLGSYPHAVSPVLAVGALVIVSIVLVYSAAISFRTIETAPERESA